jgi:dTDP-4-amino-4,6-dideoxygalactose transaminase
MNKPVPRRIFLSPPDMGGAEISFIQEAFRSNYIAPIGPMVDSFEKEFAQYVGIPHCLAVASGTAAMHLALRELGVGAGDEVLASTLTFIGGVSSVAYLGATLAFVDSDPSTWTMDPDLLAAELAACGSRGRLPKVVIPTDLYGQCSDLVRIKAVCDPYGIPVVADAAEAVGAFYDSSEAKAQQTADGGQMPRAANSQAPASDWRHAGCGAHAAIYSFNGNKIITTSSGGVLASEDARLIERARKLSQQAREPVPHYEHVELGYNYRMSNLLAAVGRGQLLILKQRVAAKRRIFENYRQLLGDLPGLQFMPEAAYGRGNRWLTVILIHPGQFGSTNEQVRLALEAENIEARPVWKPMHLQPVFRGCRIRGGGVSEQLFREGLCLPSGTAMTSAELERVAQIIRRCCRVSTEQTPCGYSGDKLPHRQSFRQSNRLPQRTHKSAS